MNQCVNCDRGTAYHLRRGLCPACSWAWRKRQAAQPATDDVEPDDADVWWLHCGVARFEQHLAEIGK